ncbi:MAG: hypothetical protein ABIY55_21520, partial [Kofleriaceae bacterium]
RMVGDAGRDTGATGLPDDFPNWHNRPGDLSAFVIMTVVELLVILAILRPWSYSRSWKRPLFAATLFMPWLLLFGAVIVHSGGIMVIHAVWLAGVWSGLVLLAVSTGLANLAARSAGCGERAT